MKTKVVPSLLLIFPLLYSAVCTSNTAPNLSLKSEDVYFQINGRIVLDAAIWDDAAFSGMPGESGAGSEIRRARIYLKGGYKDWHYRLQTDFAGDKISNKSTYIKYTGFEDLEVYIGKHKEPFGLENLSSSKHISAIERSASTGNFAGDRAIGISLAGKGLNHSFHVGLFDSGSSTADTNLALTGRATYAAINNQSQVLHLGGSYSTKQLDETESFSIKNRAGVHSTSIKSIVSGAIQGKSSQAYDLEVSMLQDSWHLSAEYIHAQIRSELENSDKDFSNSYVQLAYFLSDDQRKYNVASGTFGSVKPSSPKGAWEIFARFEDIDLLDLDQGTEANIWTTGVNWFANKYTRLSINYVSSQVDYGELTNEGAKLDGKALNMRAQFHF